MQVGASLASLFAKVNLHVPFVEVQNAVKALSFYKNLAGFLDSFCASWEGTRHF